MHDPRVGRFFAVDPLAAKYPWYTPYQFSGNKVIQAIELEGLEELNLSTGIPNGEPVRGYMVQKGDNLTKIAESTNTDLGELVRINSEAGRIDNKDLIYPGDILYLEDPSFIGVDENGMRFDRNQTIEESDFGKWLAKEQRRLKDEEQGIALSKFSVDMILYFGGGVVSGTTPGSQRGGNRTNSKYSPSFSSSSNAINRAKAITFNRTETIGGNASSRTVRGYMDDFNNGGSAAVRPINVAEIKGNRYVLDGHHRLEAAIRTGNEIRYNVIPESQYSSYGYTKDQIISAYSENVGMKIKLNRSILYQ